ncbi:MAG TPA: trypsin-like peptidase domain-containing protein [Rhodopila sp.]|jgi:serine protease Do|nr:trypsin-like peptidase domain-containing protein [Rhodopila sp.]
MGRPRASLRQFLPLAAIIAALAWAAVLPARADDSGGANQSDVIRGLLPTVVNISVRKVETPTPPATGGTATVAAAKPSAPDAADIQGFVGSGFVIDPSGVIVTNYHVVEGAFQITVTFFDGTRLEGKTLSASRVADLALLKVEAGHPLPVAHWGDSDTLHVGDQVFAAGNPFGLGISITAGIVSALNRDIQNSPYDDLIQTDAMINHGNSGGPLFNMKGQVVAVDSTIISPTTGAVGLGFAIPASSAHFVVDQLQKYGWVHPGWIGMKVQQVTQDMAEAMGQSQMQGSIVSWVFPDGPAKKAGLQIGDVILQYDHRSLSDERALLRSIAHTPVGDPATLLVRRAGQDIAIPVTVEQWPRNEWEARDAPAPVQVPKIPTPPDLGLTLAPLPASDRPGMGLPTDVGGVLVTAVAPDSDPARRGMASGDVILRVRGQQVAAPTDVWAALTAARADKRDFVMMLVLPKTRDTPGPKWLALQLMQPAD